MCDLDGSWRLGAIKVFANTFFEDDKLLCKGARHPSSLPGISVNALFLVQARSKFFVVDFFRTVTKEVVRVRGKRPALTVVNTAHSYDNLQVLSV